MPLTITKKNGKFCVTDPAGKEFGCHATKKGAVKQIGAIESNKAKSGIDLAADERIRILAAELEAEHSVKSPPIVIVSDGSPEGTYLLLHGQLVEATRISLYCSRSKDYPHCDLSITVEETGEDGLIIERTLTLRKEPSELPEPKGI